MDGTGDLFASFVHAVRTKTQVVRYPASRPLTYGELEDLVLSQLPATEPYVLLGESFSGPIAIAIAARRPPLLRGLVLCCSFARNPRPGLSPLRGLVGGLPARPPVSALMWFLAGRFATPELRQALSRALAQVAPSVLRSRLRAAMDVDVAPLLRSLTVPVLYLRALEDRVVPASASRLVMENVDRGRTVDLAAPHFLLQVAPEAAARVVEDFVRAAIPHRDGRPRR